MKTLLLLALLACAGCGDSQRYTVSHYDTAGIIKVDTKTGDTWILQTTKDNWREWRPVHNEK
jgi:hypothetical protein